MNYCDNTVTFTVTFCFHRCCHLQGQKQAKVKQLERQIDQLVYKLYDLTEEEIKTGKYALNHVVGRGRRDCHAERRLVTTKEWDAPSRRQKAWDCHVIKNIPRNDNMVFSGYLLKTHRRTNESKDFRRCKKCNRFKIPS